MKNTEFKTSNNKEEISPAAARKRKTALTFMLLLAVVPALSVVGVLLFPDRSYPVVALGIAVLSVLPILYSFERRENTARELTLLAVLVALSAAGRFIFAWLPGFKPVTALTVIVALHLGREAGFVVGAMSAVVSGFYFGQGPWTPFQMFAWGLIGLCAGLLARPLRKNTALLCVFGALSGVAFSVIMDVFTVLWADGGFNAARYFAAVVYALPVTAEYAVSNVIFLLLLAKPLGKKLTRVKEKFGLFEPVLQ